MSYRKNIFILLFITGLAVLLGLITSFPDSLGLCKENNGFTCLEQFSRTTGEPLLFASPFIFLTLLILYFTSEDTFNTWKKFGLAGFILGLILVILTPSDCNGGWITICLTKTFTSLLIGVLFLVISLIIILVKSLQRKPVVD